MTWDIDDKGIYELKLRTYRNEQGKTIAMAVMFALHIARINFWMSHWQQWR